MWLYIAQRIVNLFFFFWQYLQEALFTCPPSNPINRANIQSASTNNQPPLWSTASAIPKTYWLDRGRLIRCAAYRGRHDARTEFSFFRQHIQFRIGWFCVSIHWQFLVFGGRHIHVQWCLWWRCLFNCRITQSDAESNAKNAATLNFSFEGGGFLQFMVFGITTCWLQYDCAINLYILCVLCSQAHQNLWLTSICLD